MSGADLANLVNEATLFAMRKDRSTVEMQDFEEARDKIMMGIARSSLVISEEEKKATAYHEAGHALLHYYLPKADPLHKVTIVPRGRALGLALSLPEQDSYSRVRGWIRDRIVISYGGLRRSSLYTARPPPERPRTLSRPPKWPARWPANGAWLPTSGLSPTARRTNLYS
jgi:cell division protease FtsH